MMIDPEKRKQALHALNGILVQLRRITLLDADLKKIATILDLVEPIPRLISVKEDQTLALEEILIELSERYPDFGIGLELFRRERAPDPW